MFTFLVSLVELQLAVVVAMSVSMAHFLYGGINTTFECALRVERHPVWIIFNHNSTMPSSHTYLMALIPKLLLRTRVKYLHRSVQTLWDYYYYFIILLLLLLFFLVIIVIIITVVHNVNNSRLAPGIRIAYSLKMYGWGPCPFSVLLD